MEFYVANIRMKYQTLGMEFFLERKNKRNKILFIEYLYNVKSIRMIWTYIIWTYISMDKISDAEIEP